MEGMPLPVSKLNSIRQSNEILCNFSSETLQIADSLLNSLLLSNYLLPSQWVGLHRRRMESRELYLLWGVFVSAWIDLASTKSHVREEAEVFFTQPDAGEPVSLRFLCDVFDLDIVAVQAVVRERIAGVGGSGRRADDLRRRGAAHRAA